MDILAAAFTKNSGRNRTPENSYEVSPIRVSGWDPRAHVATPLVPFADANGTDSVGALGFRNCNQHSMSQALLPWRFYLLSSGYGFMFTPCQ